MLDQGISVALWGARRPEQLRATAGVAGWSTDRVTRAAVDRILSETIADPVGPEFLAGLQRT
jgi:aryl-alcohol dehydrogenase-like predicted oxidoreductase